MDPLQSKENDDDAQIENPLIITTNAGEICIQLEGSHTTSTETETVLSTNKKNVKFEDENKEKSKERKPSELNDEEENGRNIKNQEDILDRRKANLSETPKFIQPTMMGLSEEMPAVRNLEMTKTENIADEIENNMLMQQDVQNISIESGEISQRFEKIIEMFDSFTKNLETLELAAKPQKLPEVVVDSSNRKRPKSESMKYVQDYEEPQKHRSRYDEYYKECQKKADAAVAQTAAEPTQPSSISASTSCVELIANNHVEEYLQLQDMPLKDLQNAAEEEKKATNVRTISTATSSCELKSLGCQTQLSDYISLNELSLLEASSLTSRSEQPNSLNNYAQAENACVSFYNSQREIIKQPLTETLIQQPLQETSIVEPGCLTQPRISVITIEANVTPSTTELGRQPFCHRLCEVIGDFCAAILLCLQVNRDCIFCMGFFAAFVVSASFLTAFFYHTLIINPTLWQSDEEMVL